MNNLNRSVSLTFSPLETGKTSREGVGCLEGLHAEFTFVTAKVTQLNFSAEPW